MADRLAHRVADAATPTVRRAWIRALAQAVYRTEFPRLYAALESRNVQATLGAISWETLAHRLEDGIVPTLADVVVNAAVAHEAEVPEGVAHAVVPVYDTTPTRVVRFSFTRTNPAALEAARRQAYELIQGLTEESRGAVRDLVVRLFTDTRETPDSIARRIRGVIGLNRQQAAAYETRRADLLSQAVLDQDMRALERAEAAAEDYRQRLLAQRAETIARTESMRASNMGQHILWQEAQAKGFLAGDQRRQWLTTPDERLCPLCEPVPDRGPVGLTEPFILGDGTAVDHPPAHPSCRCTVALYFP